ncbi:VOC family protein [Amycolatopsis sp.]|jgi:catechol-2,3-dioxygenase|uniref:VOC family protein n=1 Tax=Amycolatopsis sp. TaxID=37632 RepID=UPI002DFCD160|nr:VOC family protein [Amycolatopsis sp.]
MSSPAKLSHVVLYSQQVQHMRDWYVRLLDGRVVHETPAIAFLTYDDEHHRIAIADAAAMQEIGAGDLVKEGSGPAEIPAGASAALAPQQLAHIAFTYPTLKDLLENWERLRNESVLPVLAVNHGPTTSMYYADPDGNQIELQIDNFDTAEGGTAFMGSESFAKNPFGELFDPGTMLGRLRAGEPAAELAAPTW